MWDGGAPSLQSQILTPLFGPHEMANPTFKGLLERLQKLPDYEGRFEKVFGAPATVPLIGKAIASYEVSLVSANSAFDRWYYGGESGALGADAQRGFRLFTARPDVRNVIASMLAPHSLPTKIFTTQGSAFWLRRPTRRILMIAAGSR